MKRKILALVLAMMMVLSILPMSVLAEETTGTNPGLGTGATVTVDWSRSKEITAFIDPLDVYNNLTKANADLADQGSEVRLAPVDRNTENAFDEPFTWSFLNGIGASETANVWDAQRQENQYYDGCIRGAKPGSTDNFDNNLYDSGLFGKDGKFTSYPAATWMHAISRAQEGWGVPSVHRFTGTFDLADSIPTGQVLSNIYIGVDSTNPIGDLMMNDGMFVFVYPAGTVITEDNFMDFLAYWATTPVNNATVFNGVTKLGTAPQSSYAVGVGDPDYDFVDGWHINVEEIPAWDVGEYANQTDWVVDIFAIEVDRGGGMAAPSVFVNWNEDGSSSGTFEIQKMVETADGYTIGDAGFTFAAYAEIDADGNPVGEPIATAITDNFGRAVFAKNTAFEPGKNYYVFEKMTSAQSAIYQYGAQGAYIMVQAVETLDPEADVPEFENDLIPSTGTLIIGKEMGTKASYSSVTGGYEGEEINLKHGDRKHQLASKIGEKGNSWFTYNDLAPLTTNPVQTFDLVTGDKLEKVGEYTVTYANGQITVTVNPIDALELIGAPHMTITNNIKDIKKTAPGQQAYPNDNYTWNGNTITIPTGKVDILKSNGKLDYSINAIDVTKAAVVYIHLGLEGYVGTYGLPSGTTFKVLVTGPSYPNGTEYEVPMNGTVKLENLKPGEYTVKEIATGWTATYYVEGQEPKVGGSVKVTVTNDATTTVRMTNEPGGSASGTFAIMKKVEGEDGYEVGAGFVFEAYAEIDADGKPVGNPIATATSNSLGIATFAENEDFEVGKIYYVFEIMNDNQKQLYKYGAANADGYIEVEAVEADVLNGEDYVMPAFYNDLALGSISGTKYRVYGATIEVAETLASKVTLAGWTVDLYNVDPATEGAVAIDTTTTDASGNYSFTELPYGDYWVVEDTSDTAYVPVTFATLAYTVAGDIMGADFNNWYSLKSNGDSATGLGDSINHAWFMGSVFTRTELESGKTIDFIAGQTLKVGTVSYLLVGDELTIDVDLDIDVYNAESLWIFDVVNSDTVTALSHKAALEKAGTNPQTFDVSEFGENIAIYAHGSSIIYDLDKTFN